MIVLFLLTHYSNYTTNIFHHVTMRVELCTLRDVSQLPSPSIYSLRIPTDQFSCTYDPFVITNEYRVRDIAMIKEDFFILY